MNARFCASLVAALLLAGSAANAAGTTVGLPHQDCTADVKSLCAGITGQAKIRECMMSHMSNLSAACSDQLSKKVSIIKECKGDVNEYCGNVKSGHNAIAKCLKGHLRDLSSPCKAQLALVAAPDNAP
jgi:cysteine rich repeat protein